MSGRGPQTFKKRQKEQQRKEKQQEKVAKRLKRKQDAEMGIVHDEDDVDADMMGPQDPDRVLSRDRDEDGEASPAPSPADQQA